jgi:hypothetical protein
MHCVIHWLTEKSYINVYPWSVVTCRLFFTIYVTLRSGTMQTNLWETANQKYKKNIAGVDKLKLNSFLLYYDFRITSGGGVVRGADQTVD